MRPSALGGYDDWPEFVRDTPALTGDELTTRVAGLLGVPEPEGLPSVRTIMDWTADGVHGSELEWPTPFGPPTRAWLVRPTDARPGPGLLGLHCHAGVKSIGAERLVATPNPSARALRQRAAHYGDRAVANELARAGFTVLCHDTFAWGSRRFGFDPMPWRLRDVMKGVPVDEDWYDIAAGHHEHTIAKAAGLLGTSFAGMVAYDDLVALNVLRAQEGVERVGVFGFSGGGGRAAALTALDPAIAASAVVCMMFTFASLVPAYLDAHSWLATTPGLASHLDHPALTAGRAAHQQLVVYAEDDELFSPEGMRDAHEQLTDLFSGAGSYQGTFLPGPHRFDGEMQDIVEQFFRSALVT